MEELEIKSQLVLDLLEAYSKLYKSEAQRQKVSCPPDCGACCFSSTIEATPIECLPLVLSFYKKARFEELYERVTKAMEEERRLCLFYDYDDENQERGQCQCYEFRPFVCRAFGLAKYLDKHGGERMGFCSKMQGQCTQALELPVMNQWKLMFNSHFTPKEIQILPLNQALYEACQSFSLRLFRE